MHSTASRWSVCTTVTSCYCLLQAADDDQRQLGRTSRNIFSLLFMLPNGIIVGVAVYGMLEAWWAGIIVILGVNLVAGVITACWHMATHLEAVKNAAVLSRTVKFVLKFLLAAAAILLFAFMVDPNTVSRCEPQLHSERWLELNTDGCASQWRAGEPIVRSEPSIH